jgi:chromosome segregation ATPase
MGAKLSDAELNAIINMTRRLKDQEALAESLQHSLTETKAKLEASDAVKQFLVTKCRDMEQSLAALQLHDSKVALQIASDQEVISFLDGRVQELESKVTQLQAQLEEATATTRRIQEQSEQKSMVMGDMLQYEREKLQESEREWKATKKLLIKEVKHCRAQVVSLQAERDGYREQNERLKSAVLSSSSSMSSPTSASHRSFTQTAVPSKGY